MNKKTIAAKCRYINTTWMRQILQRRLNPNFIDFPLEDNRSVCIVLNSIGPNLLWQIALPSTSISRPQEHRFVKVYPLKSVRLAACQSLSSVKSIASNGHIIGGCTASCGWMDDLGSVVDEHVKILDGPLD